MPLSDRFPRVPTLTVLQESCSVKLSCARASNAGNVCCAQTLSDARRDAHRARALQGLNGVYSAQKLSRVSAYLCRRCDALRQVPTCANTNGASQGGSAYGWPGGYTLKVNAAVIELTNVDPALWTGRCCDAVSPSSEDTLLASAMTLTYGCYAAAQHREL